tara:strand:+ start:676 stop:1962 length:1287 start_codon:yes stop_codon:yes gene_type:complete
MKKLLLIELNEINFDLIKKYLEKYPDKFPNLQSLYKLNHANTFSEFEYHELEPWIQWVSVHTGKNFEEHKIFRLGDMVNSNLDQIFEKVENQGFSVGVVSGMNVKNSLKKPSYFIPDPWTNTDTDGNFFSNLLKSVLVQTVNDNSESRITIKSIFSIFLIFLRYIKIKDYFQFISMALSSFGKSWRKALFLDFFIHKIHLKLIEENNPNFSTVFLNAGAHIQHHYLFNSEFSKRSNPSWYIDKEFDPFMEMLQTYEKIVKDYIGMAKHELIFATGLSQKEFDSPVIYWRVKNHSTFLEKLNISFKEVQPRMTRDFLIEFDNNEDMENCYCALSDISDQNNVKLFGILDKREKSLFATLTYPKDIKDASFSGLNENIILADELVFVAIKNGEHSANGEVFATFNIPSDNDKKINITGIFDLVNSYFQKN